jgi:hypothetical protein
MKYGCSGILSPVGKKCKVPHHLNTRLSWSNGRSTGRQEGKK